MPVVPKYACRTKYFFYIIQFSSFQLVKYHGPPQIATVDACVCDFWFQWFATGMPLVCHW